jgi:hypothetical protein
MAEGELRLLPSMETRVNRKICSSFSSAASIAFFPEKNVVLTRVPRD